MILNCKNIWRKKQYTTKSMNYIHNIMYNIIINYLFLTLYKFNSVDSNKIVYFRWFFIDILHCYKKHSIINIYVIRKNMSIVIAYPPSRGSVSYELLNWIYIQQINNSYGGLSLSPQKLPNKLQIFKRTSKNV